MPNEKKLILASSSRFRQQQLRLLHIPFEAVKPDFEETPLAVETAPQTALRLARGKAQSLAELYPEALIIGCDQVAWCREQQLGKPLTVAKAQQMLKYLSGQEVIFYSALTLLNVAEKRQHQHIDETRVQMRALTDTQINHYLTLEADAVYCAGAAKSEGLGALLIKQIDTTDPNALIGLPIFRLVDFLLAEGINVL
ncbi:Maf family protein [Snodgrassella alvi]|uniref:7-methyl-GTP pyrophosphatase n=1 Tax=Snodgrassella alvi TaxID=1196083 RepID=A0A2N9X8M8_9NEIS|nr:nucleoside triphosphate pyrophosphatase [Snodgrassella alvi]PIT40716.1 septum formation protein Maf [Snodgrassella alvi]